MNGFLNRLGFGSKRPKKVDEVQSFKEKQLHEGAFDARDRGIREVPVDRIVGSVGRYHDFDRTFRLKRHVATERFENIKNAMRNGKNLPPVELCQIKKEYFVLDGNHRISAAKELAWSDIKAHIQEFIPTKDTLENIIFREKAEFDDNSELRHTIELTEVGQTAVPSASTKLRSV